MTFFDLVIIIICRHKLFCRQHCSVLCQVDVGNGKQESCKSYQRYLFWTLFFSYLLPLSVLHCMCIGNNSFDHLLTCHVNGWPFNFETGVEKSTKWLLISYRILLVHRGKRKAISKENCAVYQMSPRVFILASRLHSKSMIVTDLKWTKKIVDFACFLICGTI